MIMESRWSCPLGLPASDFREGLVLHTLDSSSSPRLRPSDPLPICSSQLSSPGLSPTQLFLWEHLCCSFHPERKLLPFPSICLFLSIILTQLRCRSEGKEASSLWQMPLLTLLLHWTVPLKWWTQLCVTYIFPATPTPNLCCILAFLSTIRAVNEHFC